MNTFNNLTYGRKFDNHSGESEEIVCITEGKQNQATVGICQSACDVSITSFVAG